MSTAALAKHGQPLPVQAERRRPTYALPALTDMQRRSRAAFEQAMRNDELRGLPTAFGELA